MPCVKRDQRRGRAALFAATFSLSLLLVFSASGHRQAIVSASGDLPPGTAPQILVGLFRASSVTFTCPGSWSLSGPDFGPVALAAGSRVAFTYSGGAISWQVSGEGGSSSRGTAHGNVLLGVSPSSGRFITVLQQENATSHFEGKPFRGCMIAMPDLGGVLVANALDFEEYIQSVVGGEMPDGWPIEANMAQAIAARSYAAYQIGLSADGGWRDYSSDFLALCPEDVRIWASDQVYRGVVEETAVTIAAAGETRGQLLTYGGTPIAAYYHSDAGGMTEDPCYVWGRSVPYLPAVEEEPHESPHAAWTVALQPAEVLSAVRQLGLQLARQPESIVGVESGVSGRWYSVAVQSASSKVTVRGTDLRRVLPQVKSTLFSSYAVGGGKATSGSLSPGLGYSVATAGGVYSDIKLFHAAVIGRSGALTRCDRGAAVISDLRVESPLAIVLQGAGWGHGVGLSQWGARGMALGGCDACTILTFYYPGTTLEQWW